MEWHPAIPLLLGGEDAVYRRHDGMRQMFQEVDEVAAAIDADWFQISDMGERIVAAGRLHIRGRASGADTASPLWVVADFTDGKVLRVRTYLNPADAPKGVGLTE